MAVRIPKCRRWQRLSRTSGWDAPGTAAAPSRSRARLANGVATYAQVEDRLVGPVDELGGGDPRAAHQVDDVGVSESLDVVDALLGEAGAVVEIDALELRERGGFVERQHPEDAVRLPQLLLQPDEGGLRHEPDEEHDHLRGRAVVHDAYDERQRVGREDPDDDRVVRLRDGGPGAGSRGSRGRA